MSTVSKEWNYGTHPWIPTGHQMGAPRVRVVVDNDFAGDPDDMFQLVHQLLCESNEVTGVVVSRLREDDSWNTTSSAVECGRKRVSELLEVIGLKGVRVESGDDRGFAEFDGPTAGSRLLVEAACAEDERPLFVAAGGGLGDVARALKAHPEIANRMTVVWIGGGEHPDLAYAPDGAPDMEYNLSQDLAAAQYVFNETNVLLYQIPRDTYRRSALPVVTLRRRLSEAGSLGLYLLHEIAAVRRRVNDYGIHPGQIYVLGDQPLVLIPSLTTTFEPDTANSDYVVRPRPFIADDGTYRKVQDARPMRIYTSLDTQLLFEDMFDTFSEFDKWQQE